MERLEGMERRAMELVRGAGRYGVYLTSLGFEVAGVAEWLELQIPRARKTIESVACAIIDELGRTGDGEGAKPNERRHQ